MARSYIERKLNENGDRPLTRTKGLGRPVLDFGELKRQSGLAGKGVVGQLEPALDAVEPAADVVEPQVHRGKSILMPATSRSTMPSLVMTSSSLWSMRSNRSSSRAKRPRRKSMTSAFFPRPWVDRSTFTQPAGV